MKFTKNALICATFMLFVPIAHAQDLSKYRQFSVGSTLAAVSKQAGQLPADATILQRSPAVIEQMEYWPVPLNNSAKASEPVQKIIFSFYNHALYKIEAVYDSESTAGLTAADMIRAISQSYGPATKIEPTADSHDAATFENVTPSLAEWVDARGSVTLTRDPFLDTFHLTVLATQMNALAEASVIEAGNQERADAPQTEIARDKKAADDLETERQANIKAFRP